MKPQAESGEQKSLTERYTELAAAFAKLASAHYELLIAYQAWQPPAWPRPLVSGRGTTPVPGAGPQPEAAAQ